MTVLRMGRVGCARARGRKASHRMNSLFIDLVSTTGAGGRCKRPCRKTCCKQERRGRDNRDNETQLRTTACKSCSDIVTHRRRVLVCVEWFRSLTGLEDIVFSSRFHSQPVKLIVLVRATSGLENLDSLIGTPDEVKRVRIIL